jgi:hypothetical protein
VFWSVILIFLGHVPLLVEYGLLTLWTRILSSALSLREKDTLREHHQLLPLKASLERRSEVPFQIGESSHPDETTIKAPSQRDSFENSEVFEWQSVVFMFRVLMKQLELASP